MCMPVPAIKIGMAKWQLSRNNGLEATWRRNLASSGKCGIGKIEMASEIARYCRRNASTFILWRRRELQQLVIAATGGGREMKAVLLLAVAFRAVAARVAGVKRA